MIESEHILDRLLKGRVSTPVNAMMRLYLCPINRGRKNGTGKNEIYREMSTYKQTLGLRSAVGTDMQH